MQPCEGEIIQVPRLTRDGQLLRNRYGHPLQCTLWVPTDATMYLAAPSIWYETKTGRDTYVDPRTVTGTGNGYLSTPYGNTTILS